MASQGAAFVLFDLSRLVSRPPLGGSDWSEQRLLIGWAESGRK